MNENVSTFVYPGRKHVLTLADVAEVAKVQCQSGCDDLPIIFTGYGAYSTDDNGVLVRGVFPTFCRVHVLPFSEPTLSEYSVNSKRLEELTDEPEIPFLQVRLDYESWCKTDEIRTP